MSAKFGPYSIVEPDYLMKYTLDGGVPFDYPLPLAMVAELTGTLTMPLQAFSSDLRVDPLRAEQRNDRGCDQGPADTCCSSISRRRTVHMTPAIIMAIATRAIKTYVSPSGARCRLKVTRRPDAERLPRAEGVD